MKKKFRRIGKTPLSVDEWSKDDYPLPPIRDWLYSKHLRRRATYKYKDGTVIVDLDNVWCVHSCRNGTRVLSVLPF